VGIVALVLFSSAFAIIANAWSRKDVISCMVVFNSSMVVAI
jgi:hypothetical protein